MTDPARHSASTSRRGFQLGLVGALVIASAVAGVAAWLLFLPPQEPSRLTSPAPRPALLDKPHRHRAASEQNGTPSAR
ncbi:MAG TPA: hypothetical protein VER11_35285 [Polyangiaceae bacterium]|nr:hypothetical protein [Polyangiaceae bacterium]